VTDDDLTIHRGLADPGIQQLLGRRLRAYRKAAGLSLQQLAQLSGVAPLTIHAAEHGGNFTIRTLLRVLRALDRLEQVEALLPPIPRSPLDLIDRRDQGG
jgi:transcriptional regulator with XRE-family HTH domain